MMVLAHAEEIHDLAVLIVQDFHFGRRLVEEHLRTPGERFDVSRMLWEYRNEPLRKRTLSSYV
jgi:hypothetical protein